MKPFYINIIMRGPMVVAVFSTKDTAIARYKRGRRRAFNSLLAAVYANYGELTAKAAKAILSSDRPGRRVVYAEGKV